MPAPIYERSDGSGGMASEATPEATNRCEGWTLYGGVESWQGSHTSSQPPARKERTKRILWRGGEPTQRSERKASVGWGDGLGASF